MEDIVKIIEKIESVDPNPGIFFTDDNMFIDRKFAMEFLEYLSTKRIRFMTHSDLDIADDEELLGVMRRAGCYAIMAGIETVNLESLEEASEFKVKQGVTALEKIEKIQSYGIGVIGSFVVGFDHDDNSIFEKIENFIVSANLFEVCVKVLTPFPGTTLRERLESEERLRELSFSKYTAREPVFHIKKLKDDEIMDGIDRVVSSYTSFEARKRRVAYFKKLMKKWRGNR
jgi:radical SAM superfamily enzyme YgiQ (UPF0313 family)